MNLADLILEALKPSALPLKTAQITKLVKPQAGKMATPKAMATALDTLVAEGRVQRIMAGKAALFATQSLESVAEAMLRPLVHAAKQPPQAAKLCAKLPAVLRAHFESALGQLVAQGDAFVMPGAKRLVHARRPKPSELMSDAQRSALRKIFDAVNAVRTEAVTLVDFAAWLDEEPAQRSPMLNLSSPAVLMPDAALLREWYEQDRLRSSTMMIAIPRTFERYESWARERGGPADSQVLRNLMTELYNSGCLLLEPCERPQDLPEHERAMLVPMSLGPPGYSWCWIS